MTHPMPTQIDIVSHAGTTRETVARVLAQMVEAGIVERRSKTVYIRDKERLDALADVVSPDNEEELSR
ncbi:MAG: winged helix-turn-helix domain-containing protein [Alphaproteobacteria bacterium]|nr:winged helix-turn-helix domain-containing protein [Alphaproteobacteria bacterium]